MSYQSLPAVKADLSAGYEWICQDNPDANMGQRCTGSIL